MLQQRRRRGASVLSLKITLQTLATIICFILCFKVQENSCQFFNRLFNRMMNPLRETMIDPLTRTEGVHPDAFRNFTQLAESRGFQAEVHKIITTDGYILSMHHLINPLVTDDERKVLRPVIILHGLMCSSDDFIMNSLDNVRPKRPTIFKANNSTATNRQSAATTKTSSNTKSSTNSLRKRQTTTTNNSVAVSSSNANETAAPIPPHELINNNRKIPNALAYTLVNNGYDVWLPNIRGNTYSKEHISLTPANDRMYWDFSLDELVKYDLPAIIAHVQKQTGKTKVAYVGHSQGTATMFALLASQPDVYTDIIEPFVALAPIAYLQHISSPLRHLIHLRPITKYFTAPVPSRNIAQRLLTPLMCMGQQSGGQNSELCANTVFLAAGFDERQYDTDRIPVYVRHVPAGTSWKVLNHYGQMYSSGEFGMYDYGQSGNQGKYKSTTPPSYNVSQIRSKSISLISCADDWFGPPEDVVRLKRELTVPIFYEYNIVDPTWKHLDFMYGKHAGSVVNTRVLKILNHFSASDSSELR